MTHASGACDWTSDASLSRVERIFTEVGLIRHACDKVTCNGRTGHTEDDMPENIPTTVASYEITDENFGFATVTFTDQVSKHNVKLPFLFPVDDVENLDAGELAWEAAAEWPEAGWGGDNPVWSVIDVTATIDGITTPVL